MAITTLSMMALAAGDARADWKTAYAEGYTLARQNRNWETVAARMEEALKEKSDEGSWVNITSGGSQPYLPYFYLGLARFNLGDCKAAVKNWKTSSSFQQFLQHRQQNAQFRELYPVCEKDIDAKAALDVARARRQEIAELSRDADLSPIWSQEPGLGPAFGRADAAFTVATKAYEDARAQDVKQRLGLFVAAHAKADQVNESLETILKTAKGRRDTLAQARRAEEARLAEAKRATNPPSGGLSGGGGTLTPGGGAIAPTDGKDAKGPQATVGGGATNPLTTPGANRNSSTTSPIVTKVDPTPRELVFGTQQYFDGNYRVALNTLERAHVPDKWQGPTLLVRAAAAYALYRSGGERDKSLLRQAEDAARQCRRARPKLEPDARLFSPGFVRFFNEKAPPERQTVRNER